MKIVVIGNGANVLSHDNGQFIDSCDRVIRINGFRISGFEAYVGTRLDIYSCWSGRLEYHNVDYLNEFNEVWFMEHLDTGDYNRDKFNKLQSHVKITTLETPNTFSTGWNSILTAIKYYDHKHNEIYVTGFVQYFNSGWYWDKTIPKETARIGGVNNICTSENVDDIDLDDDTIHPLLLERMEMKKLVKSEIIYRIDNKKM